jgi:hypothetical protein
MKIDRINYQKTFNLGNYCSERVGIEMEIIPGEELSAMEEAKKFVEEWHKLTNPQLYNGSQPPINGDIPITKVEKEPSSPAGIIAAIYSCTELPVLMSYKKISKLKHEYEAAFNQQLKNLTK